MYFEPPFGLMTLLIPIEDLLFELFPDARGDRNALLEQVRKHYTVAGVEPKVRVENEVLVVEIDAEQVSAEWQARFNEAERDCAQGRFALAKPKLQQLARSTPWSPPMLHSTLGQVHYELGEYDQAMDAFIEALRRDPTDHRALVMMGNLWMQVKREPKTAKVYYRDALRHHPNDHIVATNLGHVLLREGDREQGMVLLERAVRIDPTYPNTHLALAQAYQDVGAYRRAFDEAVSAIRFAKGTPLLQPAMEQATYNAHRCVQEGQGARVVTAFTATLEQQGGRPVQVNAVAELNTAARLELAEKYGRPAHAVVHKDGLPAVEHLIVHELHHLRMILEAREQGCNERFITTEGHRKAFRTFAAQTVSGLAARGIGRDAVEHYLDALFHGLMLQAYNAPLDLFIEYDIHREHLALQPHQYLSLGRLVEEAVKAGSDAQAIAVAGAKVARPNRLYTATLAMLYHELYGVDMTPRLGLSPADLTQAQAFYNEFKEYRDDREPGEEYELVTNWAKDLGLNDLFALEPEPLGTQEGEDALSRDLDAIEADPIGDYTKDPEAVQLMRTFQEQAREQGTNMAVVMFMVDALKFYKGQSKEAIKKSAFEIAMLGTQGIHPEKQGYKLASVPGTTFSGFHLLAYYYVSFKLVLPELLPDLQLPYDAEYAMAEQLYTATP